ncbi:uncharacterized protein DUF4340 [Aliiruegeria haliotis]|uniref:Uncharacterized protein DUF4340 n=1 Tax=Aliiruegeria haliotis TaxID=1280846 RepID=A0A2T0RMV8_9RHOB|nr:DUF4340 domain-containing protein [Aliiruegeria haliotis]PRY22519.1 uncharacterized protein DUF4340 [Aliiruegeria haliotis]
MARTSFFILAGATALTLFAAAGTAVFDRSAPALAAAGEKLFPDLDARSATIASVTVRDGDFEAVIQRRDGIFVDAASGYPVAQDALQELVGSIGLAEIAEAKTTDPTRHADLGLADPTAGDGAGTEVILENAEGGRIAHVIAGDRDITLGGTTGGQFLRRGDENETWLARARIEPPTRRAGWFETRLFETDADRITSATLQPATGAAIAFERSGDDFIIGANLLDGKEQDDGHVARIPRLFETLDFADVRPDGGEADTGVHLSASMEAGTHITLHTLPGSEGDDRRWVRIEVQGETKAADALRSRVDGFAFALSANDAKILGWTLADLSEDTAS